MSLLGAGSNNACTQKVTKNQIFISFSFKALGKAEYLKKRIEESLGPGTCWICTEGVRGGQGIRCEIAKAMELAEVVICAISEGYTDSVECQSEVNLARELKKTLIPVLLDKVQWPLRKSDGEISEMSYIFAGKLYQAIFSENTADRERDLACLTNTLREELALGKDQVDAANALVITDVQLQKFILASVPHSLEYGFRNILAIACATDIEFKEAHRAKSLIAAQKRKKKKRKKHAYEAISTTKGDDDDEINFGLFD